MFFFRLIAVLFLALSAAGGPVLAQETEDPRAATGGAQTLEDILARQRGLEVDDSFRSGAIGDPENAAPITDQLGTLGGVSDAELWRGMRFDEEDVTASTHTPTSGILIQDGGMRWLDFRKGPLLTYGGYLLLGVLALLALFYLIRGKIRIDGPRTGRTVLRFQFIERFAHWLIAGSFILLGVTGLLVLFGRVALIPLFGHDAFGVIATGSKWIHNSVSWAFMLGLLMVFVFWVAHNLPSRTDLKWLAVGGGLFSKGKHPPAKKFNAGQKLIFWSVVVLGISISLSGLALLFPFDLPMFAATFQHLNALGLPQLVGYGPLPETLSPYQEMQLSQAWHGIVAFVFIAIIIAHIYIGSIGMEGAFDAMGSGEVDEQWAKEHHSLWYAEVKARQDEPPAEAPPATPAE